MILPIVRVPHLASHALNLCLSRLRNEWTDRYGFVLVETFVDPSHFARTCYRMANWRHVGQTAARATAYPNGKVAEKAGRGQRRYQVPIEDEKNFKWLVSYRAAAKA